MEDSKMDALKIISEGSIKAEKPQFNVGDTVRVDVRIKKINFRLSHNELNMYPILMLHFSHYKRAFQ